MHAPLPADKLIRQMAERVNALSLHAPLYVGIHTGGVWVAERLHQLNACAEPLGSIDISFYRDDFSRVGLNPQVKASALPTPIDKRHILLVDDVLHTGRTIRAALNEIFSYARPASVTLAVLIDRDGRELPIQADIVGQQLELAAHEQVQLTNMDGALQLDIVRTKANAA